MVQVLAALRAHGSEMDAGLPQQAMQAEMAAFLVTPAHTHLCTHAVTPAILAFNIYSVAWLCPLLLASRTQLQK